MKTYELTYLISSELTEEQAKELQNKVSALIQGEEGLLIGGSLISKKRLAYAIKKQSQAYLVTTIFQLLPEKLANLEKALKTDGQILRYIILIKRPVKEVKKSRMFIEPKIEKPKKEKKVELEAIEKKLEEILAQSDEG
ncbi:MAG: 30S ribosomal protein S6 [bacterium]|nr:30S ribosomal protein S6 [bacterium]